MLRSAIRIVPSKGRTVRQLSSARSYYSIHHPDPPPFPAVQEKILSAALRHVPRYGFSHEALLCGAREENYLEVSVQLFPRGIYDLINYYLVSQRLALKDRVQFPSDGTATAGGGPSKSLGVGRKVKSLTWERLLANKEIIHHWQAALGHMSLLENIPASITELNLLADEIWYLAGDTAVDFSWYTKRGSLAAVYASSELFMTTDTSRDFAATEEFLERRLEDVRKVGGAVGGFTSYVGFWAGNGVNLARAWGLKV